MSELRVALIQMNSGADPDDNFSALATALSTVEAVDLVILPELCLVRGGEHDCRQNAAPLRGRMTRQLGALARENACYLLAGSIPELDGKHIYNTAILFNKQGGIAATYRKIHLFECLLPDGIHIREADVYQPGVSPVVCRIDAWLAGMSICYDIRFPGLYQAYARQGAAILLIPSDFTAHTGQAHWHILVRARAIESQSYVLAANQCGTNPVTGVESYGHSMIVSPWGDIVAEAGTGPTVLTATLDAAFVKHTRATSPVLHST